MYPAYNQEGPQNPKCAEETAYPAGPDSEQGWEKLFSERLYFTFSRNYGLNVRVARFHNIFGRRAPGAEAKRRFRRHCAARLQNKKTAARLKYRATVSRPARSCALTNAWKRSGGLCRALLPVLLILDLKRWLSSIKWP